MTALFTPWLFELGRIAFGAALYPLAVVLLLMAIYNAYRKAAWTVTDYILIGLGLAGCTYTYAVGRLLGPLLALLLLLFATSFRRFKDVFFTWVAYGITLIPLAIFHFTHPGALAGRFNYTVGIIKAGAGYWENAKTVYEHYVINTSVYNLLYTGDPILRHHITDTPAFLAPIFALAMVGLIVILIRHRTDPWWRYIIVGLFVIPIPSSLTLEPFHMLRLAALPVFLLVLAIPGLMWMFEIVGEKTASGTRRFSARLAGGAVLVVLLLLTVVQAINFQVSFWNIGPYRSRWFDDAYPKMMAAAMANGQRPIYLLGQSYIHAMWQSAVQDIDESNFVKLAPGQQAPGGALVLSGEDRCTECEMIMEDGGYLLYKKLGQPEPTAPEGIALIRGAFSKPRGVAVDAAGNLYVADTGHARIQKVSPTGEFLTYIGADGSGEGVLHEPIGVALDEGGNIYVTDGTDNTLTKFNPEGAFVKKWRGPDPGFYGPRDVAVGPGQQIFVLDQGRGRVVKFDPASEASKTWGQTGEGEGQFNELTGIAVGTDRIFVADARNDRIQVFDLEGKFITQWPIPQWEKYIWHFPDVAFDKDSRRVYVTSGWSNEVLVFDENGQLLDSMKAGPTTNLDNPSSLVISRTATGKRLYVLNTGNVAAETGGSSIATFELADEKPAKTKVPASKKTASK